MTRTTTHPEARTRSTAGQRRALGAYGEELAARHLEEQGMVVLDRNWRCELGEIDLVLRDRGVLVVCEVKTRTTVYAGTPHEAITDAKLARLRALAERWAHAHGLGDVELRVDLVAVLRPHRGPSVLDHVQGL